MTNFTFSHQEHAPVSGSRAGRIVIVLHGYGSNGARAMEQATWLAPAFPDAAIYAPDGTFPYIPFMDPKGGDLSAEPVPGRFVWYHRYSEASRQEGLAATRVQLDSYIDECAAAHGLDRERVALIGISQGAILTLNAVPYLGRPVGASVAHSGYLFSPDSLATHARQAVEFKAAMQNRTTPMCSIHGFLDFTLPWQSHLAAASLFDDAGLPVEFHLLGSLKHADFEPRSQAVATEFIRRHLG